MSTSSHQVASMTFPYEIYDEIISAVPELDESRTTIVGILSRCALVCRGWLPRCQHHLYSTVYLRMYNPTSYIRLRYLWRTLRNTPHISPLVRELTVSDGVEGQPGGILRLLPIFLAWKLPNISALTLLSEGTRLELHPSFFAALTTMKALTSLRLIQTRIIRTEFHRVLAALPHVSDLKLDGVAWQDLRESCVHQWPGYRPNIPPLSSLCMTDTPKADTEYAPFTYRAYMLLILSVLGPTVSTLHLDIDAFYKTTNIIEELPNVPPILYFKRLRSLTLRYCWKFKPTESPPEGFLSFLDRLEAPSLQTLNIALQVRPKHELGDPDTLFGVARNIDIYASRVTSLTVLNILVIFDLNFLLQWDKDSFKEQLSDHFLCHPAFEQWRRTSKLFARGVLTIKFAI
ncbi:hypothetical protein OH76DRAFT_797653 [Lentinus brumalis]|uniref:F-box domain-containing protein n=1 Tax=Lentinus brumalis TaxID=2498619 RepID=A0A371D3R9_9APHY|nr:hypothetical protein OH76DRAFT_797653 [Polyporus brumalis]